VSFRVPRFYIPFDRKNLYEGISESLDGILIAETPTKSTRNTRYGKSVESQTVIWAPANGSSQNCRPLDAYSGVESAQFGLLTRECATVMVWDSKLLPPLLVFLADVFEKTRFSSDDFL